MNPVAIRLLNQQLVAPQFSDPAEVVSFMGAMHAQEYRMMRWAIAMRTRKPSLKTFKKAFDSGRIIRLHQNVPLTLAVLNNALRDVLMGMILFFVGDVIDFFHRANTQNMQMIQGFVDGDETVITQVNQRALQSAIVLILLLLLIGLMIWLLTSFGSYLYSLLTSIV